MVKFGLLPNGVILSGAVFQAERRISRLIDLERQPHCTTTGNGAAVREMRRAKKAEKTEQKPADAETLRRSRFTERTMQRPCFDVSWKGTL